MRLPSNDMCGNFSAEYGGGISHFGSVAAHVTAASIHDNRIYFNHSYDEGAGIMIAGELATDPDCQLWPTRRAARLRRGEYLQQPDPGQHG